MDEDNTVVEFPSTYRRSYEERVDKYELAKFLGKSVSWVQQNGHMFPRMKVGGTWKYRLSEVERRLRELNEAA